MRYALYVATPIDVSSSMVLHLADFNSLRGLGMVDVMPCRKMFDSYEAFQVIDTENSQVVIYGLCENYFDQVKEYLKGEN